MASETFDAYHKWLGIPPKDQPPNHYRLLAIDLFESDPDVIAAAADQRMAHVHTFQIGKNAALSQEILNEISAARVCLLNREKKAQYDLQLGQQLALEVPAEQVPPKLKIDDSPLGHIVRCKRLFLPAVIAGVAAVILMVVAGIFLPDGSNSDVVTPDEKPPVPDPPPEVPIKKPPTPDQPPSTPDEKPPTPDPKPPVPNPPPEVPNEKPPTPEPPDEPPSVPAEKLPVPDDAALAEARQRLEATVADASLEKLLELAAEDRDAAERFVLFSKARDRSADVVDVVAALRVVDKTAERFEIDPLLMKAETVIKLADGAKTTQDLKAVTRHGLTLIEQARAQQQRDLAGQLSRVMLATARKSGDADLVTKATLHFLELHGSSSAPEAKPSD